MGCIVCSGSVETLKSELSEQKSKLKECSLMLAKPESNDRSSIELLKLSSFVNSELKTSLSNLKFFMKYFPIDDANEDLPKKIAEFKCNLQSDQDYLAIRLEESDIEKNVCYSFGDLIEKLKKQDIIKGQNINSKATSIEKIIIQGQHDNLMPDLQSIKEKQILLSSFRGGGFEDIIMRVNIRYELDKDLEIIQTKLEEKQYSDSLQKIEDESKELYSKIRELKNTKNDLERAWDMVRLNTKSNDEEIASLKVQNAELQPVVDQAETEVVPLREEKIEMDNLI